jgi:hypothetical protein
MADTFRKCEDCRMPGSAAPGKPRRRNPVHGAPFPGHVQWLADLAGNLAHSPPRRPGQSLFGGDGAEAGAACGTWLERGLPAPASA